MPVPLSGAASPTLAPAPRKASPPGLTRTQAAFIVGLACVQFANVAASVYLRAALSSTDPPHPVVFALYREVLAGGMLLGGATWLYGLAPARRDAVAIGALGACLFFNQLLYVLGLQLAGVTLATCLQPSIPVLTVLLCMLVGQEHVSVSRCLGAFAATGGAVMMVYGASLHRPSVGASAAGSPALGALCLIGNCTAMAAYFVIARRMGPRYPSICLTAWAYVGAAACMAVTAALCVPAPAFALPRAAFGPLAVWVFISSMVGYSILTAATQVLPASSVSASICLQPLAGSALAVAWLQERLSGWDAGAILILAGLAMVLLDTAQSAAAAARPARRASDDVSELGTLRDGQGSSISLTGSSFMSASLSFGGASPPRLSGESSIGSHLDRLLKRGAYTEAAASDHDDLGGHARML